MSILILLLIESFLGNSYCYIPSSADFSVVFQLSLDAFNPDDYYSAKISGSKRNCAHFCIQSSKCYSAVFFVNTIRENCYLSEHNKFHGLADELGNVKSPITYIGKTILLEWSPWGNIYHADGQIYWTRSLTCSLPGSYHPNCTDGTDIIQTDYWDSVYFSTYEVSFQKAKSDCDVLTNGKGSIYSPAGIKDRVLEEIPDFAFSDSVWTDITKESNNNWGFTGNLCPGFGIDENQLCVKLFFGTDTCFYSTLCSNAYRFMCYPAHM